MARKVVRLLKEIERLTKEAKKKRALADTAMVVSADIGGLLWREAKEVLADAERIEERLEAFKSLRFSMDLLIRDSQRMCFHVARTGKTRAGGVSGSRSKKLLSRSDRSILKNGEFVYEFDNMVLLAKALKVVLPKGADMMLWRIK